MVGFLEGWGRHGEFLSLRDCARLRLRIPWLVRDGIPSGLRPPASLAARRRGPCKNGMMEATSMLVAYFLCASATWKASFPDGGRTQKKPAFAGFHHCLAERQGFEPREAFTSTVFKTAAIDHSAISPDWVAKITDFCQLPKKLCFCRWANSLSSCLFLQSISSGRGSCI